MRGVGGADTRPAADATATWLRADGTPVIVGGLGNDLTELIQVVRRATAKPPTELPVR